MPVSIRSVTLITIASTILAGIIGYLDYVTVIDFAVFYLLPIFFAAWYGGRMAGTFTSFVCSALWLYDDLITASPPFSDPHVRFWSGVVRLVFYLIIANILTMLHTALQEEKKLARTDSTTQIANKKHFLEFVSFEVNKTRRYRHPFSLAFMDVDNFKTVNDQWGHHQGDELLRMVARNMQNSLRDTDLVARVGGDEFAILFSETDADAARDVTRKMKDILTAAVKRAGYPVTFSFGVATFLSPPSTVDNAIKLADDAMYTAKRKGKNMIIHEVFGRAEAAVPVG